MWTLNMEDVLFPLSSQSVRAAQLQPPEKKLSVLLARPWLNLKTWSPLTQQARSNLSGRL